VARDRVTAAGAGRTETVREPESPAASRELPAAGRELPTTRRTVGPGPGRFSGGIGTVN